MSERVQHLRGVVSSRDVAACHAAIHGLLHGIPEEQRAHAALFLLDDLERLYRAAGRPLLDPLRVLREYGGLSPPIQSTSV